MRILTGLVSFLLSATLATAGAVAQEVPRRPAALGALAKLLGQKQKQAAPKAEPGEPAAPATRFRRAARPVLLPALADAFGQDDEQKQALREALVAACAEVEKQLAAAGHADDAAAGLAFGIAFNWGLWSGEEVGDPASEALLRQLQGLFDTPEFRGLKDADKQQVWEYGAGLGVFMAIMVEAAEGDAETLAGARAFAGQILEHLLGADPAQLTLTDDGLGVKGGGARAAAAGAVFEVRAPQGWTREEDADFVTLLRSLAVQNDSNEPLSLRVIVGKQGYAGEDPETAVRQCYDRLLRPLIPKDAQEGGVMLTDASPDLLRRYVANGLRCHFAGVAWSRRESGLDYFGTAQELHLYLVESGGLWYPVVARFGGMKGTLPNGEFVRDGVRHEWLEELWAAARGEPGKAPLIAPEELIGTWEMSATTGGPFYYNAMTGASMGMGMVVRNNRIEFRADGTYEEVFVGGSGIGTVAIQKQTSRGTWKLQSDPYGVFLLQTEQTRSDSQNRLGGVYTLPDGRRVLVELRQDDMVTLPIVNQHADRYFPPKQ